MLEIYYWEINHPLEKVLIEFWLHFGKESKDCLGKYWFHFASTFCVPSLIDKEGILKVVLLLVNKYVAPADGMEMEKQLCEVVDSLLTLLLRLLDVPVITIDLAHISSLYAPVFKLRTLRWIYLYINASNCLNRCFYYVCT